MARLQFCDYHNMVAILEKEEFNTDFHPMVDFIAASPLRYALTVWSTARIETTDEGTHILATVDGIQRTVSEASLRRNLKLRDEDGIMGEHNIDFHPMVDFIEASPLRYALTVKPTVYVSHIRQFWSTTRIETTEEGTKILATVYGIIRTVSESSLRFNRLFHLENNKDCFVSQRILNGSWEWDWCRPITMGRSKTEFDNLIIDISNMEIDDLVESDTCEALDEEAYLEEQILSLMHRFADRFTYRRPKINRLNSLPDHPLIKHGRYALGCMTGANMKKATNLKIVRDELLRSMKEKRQLIKNYKEM
nr:RNA-directed DNA polymerase, eukaryota, reverse transcriptase zinc-binding domain protein [Tanacetum cinerariifolium]